jgi:hypothetical protein
MNTLRGWIVMSWIMLPGVMVGGSLLLRRLTVGERRDGELLGLSRVAVGSIQSSIRQGTSAEPGERLNDFRDVSALATTGRDDRLGSIKIACINDSTDFGHDVCGSGRLACSRSRKQDPEQHKADRLHPGPPTRHRALPGVGPGDERTAFSVNA